MKIVNQTSSQLILQIGSHKQRLYTLLIGSFIAVFIGLTEFSTFSFMGLIGSPAFIITVILTLAFTFFISITTIKANKTQDTLYIEVKSLLKTNSKTYSISNIVGIEEHKSVHVNGNKTQTILELFICMKDGRKIKIAHYPLNTIIQKINGVNQVETRGDTLSAFLGVPYKQLQTELNSMQPLLSILKLTDFKNEINSTVIDQTQTRIETMSQQSNDSNQLQRIAEQIALNQSGQFPPIKETNNENKDADVGF